MFPTLRTAGLDQHCSAKMFAFSWKQSLFRHHNLEKVNIKHQFSRFINYKKLLEIFPVATCGESRQG